VRKEAAVVALGCAISAAIVLWSLHPSPLPPPPEAPQETTPPPPHAPWVEFYEERPGCGGGINPLIQTLLWLVARRNEDGSYGNGPVQLDSEPLGKTGLTSLVLLPLMGAGFLPYSKDVYPFEGGDWNLGKEVQTSLQWLLRDQRDDGTFRSAAEGTFDQILATFALSEVYGITEAAVWKQPAQRAVDALLKMQEKDGSWGAAGPSAWAIIALRSAELSRLSVDAAAIRRVPLAPGLPRHPGESLARVLGKSDAKTAVFPILYEAREHEGTDVAWWYLATLSMWAYDGSGGKEWYDYKPGPEYGAWNPVVREKLLPLFDKDGSLSGVTVEESILQTSLEQLTLEVYYRYTNVFRPH
jgi:hypothetical protein